MNPDTPLPYQRPCASRSTSTRRCIPTGTSSPRSPSAASGSSCPTTRSSRGRSTGSSPSSCKADRRRDPQRASTCSRAEPYPGAVRDDPALARRRATSSTSRATAPPTRTRTRASGCDQIGLPHDELYCSYDKITRCVEIGIDVLIDDSPDNLARAVEAGSPRRRSSTRGTGTCPNVISAPDWPTLAQRLEPHLDDDKELDRPARAPRAPAGDRARAPDHRLGPLRARRVGAFDKTLYEFLYHYWFRVEVEGIEHVPATGGALLVSNHAGALPPDAAMIAKAIKTEHARPRPLHLTVEHFFKGYPGLSMLDGQARRRPRAPRERAPPALRRGAARARLPRGPQGHREALQGPLPAAALRPRRLRRVRDARARRRSSRSPWSAPRRRCRSSPSCNPLKKLTGLIYFPITPTFPLLGLLGGVGYLPAKFLIRFLEPIPTDQWGDEPWNDKGLVQTVAEEVRARIQEELYEMLADRTLGLARMTGPPRPDHRALQLLGRPPRAGARDATRTST